MQEIRQCDYVVHSFKATQPDAFLPNEVIGHTKDGSKEYRNTKSNSFTQVSSLRHLHQKECLHVPPNPKMEMSTILL